MKDLQGLKTLLASPKKVVIVTHFKPDADALGSSLGLAGYLVKKGHSVAVISPSDYPDFLAWMPGKEMVIALTKDSIVPQQKAKALIEACDILFCLDFSSLKRINEVGDMVKTSTAKKVMIDHHLEPEKFADFEKWDVSSASTAELIFELIDEWGDLELIDQDIANCLYAGLMTDTGGFRHNNTTNKEFLIASELVSRGANPSEVAKKIYDTNSLERLRLTGYALSQKLVVLPEYNTAYMTLTWEELRQFGSQTGDTEGLVNYGLSIKGIKMAVLMYDRKEEIKLSFRSLADFDVNALARKHFEGGGHKNASGGQSKQNLEETLKKFLAILPEYKADLNK
ncbi:MAG: bifunctional oligoribonuclease/PAP phosphatase NrnA [Cytophagales bacterium]|jgi:phosphoesterase RecJ-like protein|nr:bifunctional oligoribonuclease/PAP phosphatase NrnA [Cytophagales bacterium]MCA6387133.1 bifunctional oligoribonuclease/PAP phosphatase NrnA [Cytophagales bacterium]MCA6390378.1 bifunctional oligoribonuclease/PAP phosphatase NrnA [Cytophagales bacterium]MCA6396117.1 bifunctional oligoribonuclease/PAP phosphatase NrnA [Cytophagales bacterium]MCA6399714.1 bifunctional oligoribonuclease/PAP phosphatase NrnA [Cytophagales bacterium]